jgi:hypothetical protein
MEDMPQSPTRTTALQVAVYAPLAAAPVPPDVVLVRGNARQVMLLAEAAEEAGAAGTGATAPRPATRRRRGEAGGDRARQPGAGEVPPRARRRDADGVG